jgi:hypothetical protein
VGARKHSNIVITSNHRFGFQFCSVSLGVNSGDLQSHFDLSLNLRTHNALDDVSSMVAVVAYLTESDSRLIEKLLCHSYLRSTEVRMLHKSMNRNSPNVGYNCSKVNPIKLQKLLNLFLPKPKSNVAVLFIDNNKIIREKKIENQ